MCSAEFSYPTPPRCRQKVFHFVVDAASPSSAANSNSAGTEAATVFIPPTPTSAELAGGVIGSTIASAIADEDFKRIRFAKGSSYNETLRSLLSLK
jgi:hypothetical protein